MQLLLKRSRPDGIILLLQTDDEIQFACKLYQRLSAERTDLKWVFILPQMDGEESIPPKLQESATLLHRPYDTEQILSALETAFDVTQSAVAAEPVPVGNTIS